MFDIRKCRSDVDLKAVSLFPPSRYDTIRQIPRWSMLRGVTRVCRRPHAKYTQSLTPDIRDVLT